MNKINYKDGDATCPHGNDNKIIVHVCNNVNAWGAGFVLAISKKWPHIKNEYRTLFNENNIPELGTVQFVVAEKKIVIANMIAQDGIGRSKIPIRYDAVEKCLCQVRDLAKKYNTSIHMPRIGCGLAGGNWDEIEVIIKRVFIGVKIPINVYNFTNKAQNGK